MTDFAPRDFLLAHSTGQYKSWENSTDELMVALAEQGQSQRLKRVVDLVLGITALVCLLPLMLLIAAAIRLESAGSPLFWQRRIGHQGKVFQVCKFRTMTVAASDGAGGDQASRNDKRFTRVGRFLRRTSLDELPQLINVLRGEMALVGPRPHAVDHHSYYMAQISQYAIRLLVKPGITGWAQVNGWRGETRELDAMIKRVDCDLEYIARRSIWFDLQIMLYTIIWYRKHSRNAY